VNPIAIAYGETWAVLRGGRDRVGDAAWTVHHSLAGCVFWPDAVTGENDRRTATVVFANLAVLRGSDVELADRLKRGDGTLWIPQGRPQWDQLHPMTGWNPGYMVVRIKGVS